MSKLYCNLIIAFMTIMIMASCFPYIQKEDKISTSTVNEVVDIPPINTPRIADTIKTPTQPAIETMAVKTFESKPKSASKKWTLTWSDEFNTLSTSNWNLLDDSNGYAKRKQHYTPKNLAIVNGILNINIKKEKSKGLPYTSGAITTNGKVHFKYGKLEIRAKFPKGKGMIPAIWMLPASGKNFPEIDIAEMIGQEPKELYNVVHNKVNGKYVREYKKTKVVDITKSYHTYTIEWTKDKITYSFDGKHIFTGVKVIPREAMYLYINAGVGGNWVGEPDSKTKFPNALTIDYVRYYTMQ